jgi:hypothetical protein
MRQQIGLALGGFVLLLLFCAVLFGLWWQRLFRRHRLSAQIYGRICLLADWAGIEIHRSQTPYEYLHDLAETTPGDAATLERLGDIYVRDLWADPASEEHPRRTGEVNELLSMWKRLQPHLFLYMLRHPHFIRWLPMRLWSLAISTWRRYRPRRLEEE